MTQYKCGHESEIIIADGGALTIAAYLEWSETVGLEGTREKCWECWCKEINEPKEDEGLMNKVRRQKEVFLLYLLLTAVAAVEVLMKLPLWASKGYSPFLFLWVFKAPLIVLLMTWYVRNRFGKRKT